MSASSKDSAPTAVVIGLDNMTGLQTARILSRQVPVIGLAQRIGHPCARTRVCKSFLETDTSGPELIETLQNLGESLGRPAALFPCTDQSVLQISRHRSALQGKFLFRLPSPEVVEKLIDKKAFHAFAASKGFRVPETVWLSGREDAAQAARQVSFPCLLKPALKSREWEERFRFKAFKIASASKLVAFYDRCSPAMGDLIVQEWIEGSDQDLFSCNCYFDRQGQPIVTFVARKLRQWPPRMGTSCLGQECRDEAVLQEALRFFRCAGLRGLGYLELKRDRRRGVDYLIEPNIGRPTGRSAMAEAAGVELLYSAYCEMAGLPLPPNRRQQHQGVKWVFLRRDLQSAWHYWRRGELSALQWLRSLRGIKAFALFSLADPAPFFLDLRRAAGLAIRRLAGRWFGKVGLDQDTHRRQVQEAQNTAS